MILRRSSVTDIHSQPRITTKDYKVANYLLNNDCHLIGIEALPVMENGFYTVPMILRGENVQKLAGDAEKMELNWLTEYEESRLFSMLALFTAEKRIELEEEADL